MSEMRVRLAVVLAAVVPSGCGYFGMGGAKPIASRPAVAEPAPTATPPVAETREEAPPPAINAWRVTYAEEGADFDPCLSSDGSRLYFSSTQHRSTSDVYMKKVGSRVVTQMTSDPADDAMPALSPDGSKLAFASNRAGSWDIYVMPAAGGKAVQITSEPADDIHPSWSPDGRNLVFCRQGEMSGRWEMWVVSVANPSQATYIGEGLFPVWCPVLAGEAGPDRILYQLPRERGRRSFALWTLDLANGLATNATEIVSSASSAFINPAWSPDGKWIVYSEVPAPPEGVRLTARPTSATIWMVSTLGSARVRVTSGQGRALSPAWGSTERLYFVSDRTGVDNIWCVDLSGSVRAAILALPEQDFTTAFLPGGSGNEKSQSKEAQSADNRPIVTAPESGNEPVPAPR